MEPRQADDECDPVAGSVQSQMSVLRAQANQAKTVTVNKRSLASGYAGLDHDLFYRDQTMTVFGDAKTMVEHMVKAVE